LDVGVVEEDQLTVSDTQEVALLQGASAYGNAVDEGTVVAIEVRDFYLTVREFDSAMLARDCGIRNYQAIRRFATNRHASFRQAEHLSLERA
jgi:hypothetical protein